MFCGCGISLFIVPNIRKSKCEKLQRSFRSKLYLNTILGHPFVGRRNEYQPKSGDALRLGSKGRHGSCVGEINGS